LVLDAAALSESVLCLPVYDDDAAIDAAEEIRALFLQAVAQEDGAGV
jgi:hypothetical protein